MEVNEFDKRTESTDSNIPYQTDLWIVDLLIIGTSIIFLTVFWIFITEKEKQHKKHSIFYLQ
jgi:hypothetical protein